MDGFEGWAEKYAATFGWGMATVELMFLQWEKAFDFNGYTLADLNEALLHISSKIGAPRFPADHLAAVHARVRQRRIERCRANEDMSRGGTDVAHARCGGSGWVVVPHLRSVIDGQWVGPYTMGVHCDCKVGVRIRDSRPGRAGWSIMQYERTNPDWEYQMQCRDAAREQDRKAMAASQDADRKLSLGIADVLVRLRGEGHG